MSDEKESYRKVTENRKLTLLFSLLFLAVTASITYIYSYYFWPFLFALFLYVALKSVFEFGLKYLKNRLLCSTLIIFSIIMLVLIPLFIILFSLADEAFELYLFLQNQYKAGVFERIVEDNKLITIIFSYANISHGEILQKLFTFLSETSLKIFSNLTAVLTFSIKFITNLFFMLLILFFLFKDGEKLGEAFYRILPFPDNIEKAVVSRLKEVIKVLLTGNVLIMILQGLVVGAAFYFFGIRMPLLWGSITAILSLIPVIGTTLVWLPVVVYFFLIQSYFSAFLILIWCLFGYLILENVVKPKIFGEKLNFHPLIFFFLLLGSIQAFNLPGIIVGPLLLTLFYSLWEIYKLLTAYSEENNQL